MDIGIVGPGRLGRSLYALLIEAGHPVVLVGRGDPIPPLPVLLLTVPDDAIAQVAATVTHDAVVLHCSGAADVEVLAPHQPAGSFHPLMTFPGPEVAIPLLQGVPVALAGDAKALEAGHAIAQILGMRAVEVPGDRRLYHCAAVIAGNFATVLLAEASRVLEAAGVPAEDAPAMLAPLAMASLQNAGIDPVAALTGPAVRGDEKTIAGHREALEKAQFGDLIRLYDLLTESAVSLKTAVIQTPMSRLD
ncbi:MAG: DUF2520 domain-containing protein [Rhodobacterales bacterium]|nr:DUF2520 domain-containing protein [Rhodobacterales bacterium]